MSTPRQILLVAGDALQREWARRVLREAFAEARLVAVSSVAELRVALDAALPDVIISGIHAAGPGWDEALGVLRARAPGVPVVLVAGAGSVGQGAASPPQEGELIVAGTREGLLRLPEAVRLAWARASAPRSGMRLPDNREFADTDEDAVCRLAARAAHDLDNLLAAVVGHVAMALDSMQEAPCATRELESVRRAAQRATGLATRLLESSRRETRRGRSPDPARLLVVEDDAGVRRLIVRALEQAGFQVDAAGGAARALELLVDPEQRIDLLITDIVMPGIGGIELARRVARIRPGVPVLFVSGCAEDLVAPRAGGGAPQDLLLKPFAREDLLANVERLLSDAAGPDALASGSEAGQPGA